MDISKFQKEVHRVACEHGFHQWKDSEATPSIERMQAWLMLIVSEIGEACECIRNDEMKLDYEDTEHPVLVFTEDGKDLYTPDKPIGFPSELADALIRILDTAEALGIDLERVALEKNEYNKTRPYMHGKTI